MSNMDTTEPLQRTDNSTPPLQEEQGTGGDGELQGAVAGQVNNVLGNNQQVGNVLAGNLQVDNTLVNNQAGITPSGNVQNDNVQGLIQGNTGAIPRVFHDPPPPQNLQTNHTFLVQGPGAEGGRGPVAPLLPQLPPLQQAGGGGRSRAGSTVSVAGQEQSGDSQPEEKIAGRELKDRQQVDTGFLKLQLYLGTRGGGASNQQQPARAKLVLAEIEELLQVCEAHAAERLGKEKDDSRRGRLAQMWVQWLNERTIWLDEYYKMYASVDPDHVSPGQTKRLARDNADRLVIDKVQDISSFMNHIETDLQRDLQGRNIPRSKLKLYNERIDKVQKMISPELEELHTQRNNLETNLATLGDAQSRQRCSLRNFNLSMDDLRSKLHSLDWGEDTSFGDFNPGAQSTQFPRQNHSSGLSGGNTSQFNQTAVLKYRHIDPPRFKGEKAKYPAWKKEMVEDVLPGKTENAQIRLIETYSPHNDLSVQFNTVAEIWRWLDKMYGDTQGSAEDLLSEFLKFKAKGSNPQQKLVAVYNAVTKLHNQLKKNGLESQFIDSLRDVRHCFNILPVYYQEKIADVVRSHEKARGRDLNAREKFEFYMEWLEDQHTNITKQLRHLLDDGKPDSTDSTMRRSADSGNCQPDKTNSSSSSGSSQKSRKIKKAIHATKAQATDPELDQLQVPAAEQPGILAKWAKWGKCPICQKPGHAFEIKKTGNWRASCYLADCPVFRDQWSVDERATYVLDNKHCVRCTSRLHGTKDCQKPKEKWYCRKQVNGKECGEFHSNHLHGTTKKIACMASRRLSATRWSDRSEDDEDFTNLMELRRDAMLPIVEVQITDKIKTCVLLDGGADCSLILNSLARQLGLKAKETEVGLTTVGSANVTQRMKYYVLNMKIAEGVSRKMVLIGIDSISDNPGRFNIDAAYKLFPQYSRPMLDKPSGNIGMLIGQDNSDLLPRGGMGEDYKDGLTVWTILLSPGRVLTGSHPDISFSNPVLAPEATKIAFFTKVDDASGTMRPLASKCPISGREEVEDLRPPDCFYEYEMMGFNRQSRCATCQKCSTCNIITKGMTVQENLDYLKMEKLLTHDPATNTLKAEYLIKGDESLFQDNRAQVLTRQTRFFNSLKKDGLVDSYNKEFQDYVDRGVVSEVSQEEIKIWQQKGGYIHYVLHHGVRKVGEKVSTKLRIVVDGSLRNNYTGPRLNDLWAKGPKCINDIYHCLTTWRSFEVALVYDIKKAYHSIFTGDKEFFMRLLIWKFTEDGDWKTFGHNVLGMGDIPSMTYLEIGKKMAAQLGLELDPLLCQQLRSMSYVDDGLGGGEESEMRRMRGDAVFAEDGTISYTGTVTQVLALIGCKPKIITISGETDQRILDKQGPVLGIEWLPTEDEIFFKLKISLHTGRGRSMKEIQINCREDIDRVTLTKRQCLQAAQQNYDPLGLIACYTVKFKLLMKEIVAAKLDWDVPLPPDLQMQAKDLIMEAVELPTIYFPRSVRPAYVSGRPELIVYSDGSTVAFGAIAYIRWHMDNPDHRYTAILSSKSRVTPPTGLTPPRSELQGLLVATRMADNIITHLSVRPRRVTILTDSQCTVAAAEVNANSLAVFFANRVIEFVETLQTWGPQLGDIAKVELDSEQVSSLPADQTYVDLLNHTPGDQNPADWPTRGNLPWSDMGKGGIMQTGPSYLKQDRSTWPITRDFVRQIDPAERKKKFTEAAQIVVNFTTTNAATSNIWLSTNVVQWKEAHPAVMKYIPVVTTKHQVISLWLTANYLLDRYQGLEKTVEAIAYLLTWWSEGKFINTFPRTDERPEIEQTRVIPTTMRRVEAEKILQLYSMAYLKAELEKKNNLESLSIFWREGIARSRGRMSPEDMERLIGYDSLVVLTPKSQLARAVMTEAHLENHSGEGETLFRSRRRGYWIIRGRVLAAKIVRNCALCIKHRAKTEVQKMADLPPEKFNIPCRPFSHIQIDFTGAYTVRDNVKKRTDMKVWPLIFVCLNTGAVYIALSMGYSAKDFLLQFQMFCSHQVTPSYVHTDMGSQLVKAGKEIVDGDAPPFPWQTITHHSDARNITWKHCPPASQWRNGAAEAAVKALKKTLRHLHQSRHRITYVEFQVLLARAANILNDRPLGVRHHGHAEGEMCAITPNMLLHGGKSCRASDCSADSDAPDWSAIADKIDGARDWEVRMRATEHGFNLWWKMWLEQVWDSLVPIPKWRKEQRNIQVGDVVLIKTTPAYGRPSTKLARVKNVFPDQHGVVRDALVVSYPKREKGKASLYKPVELDVQKLPVQRLVLMISAEDILKPKPNHAVGLRHLCDEDMRVPLKDPDTTSQGETTDDDDVLSRSEESIKYVKRVNALITFAEQDNEERYCWRCEVKDHLTLGL